MSDVRVRITARRIVAAVDASQRGLEALEQAVRLAAELEAELQGVFVEDEDLLRLAGLPFASEVTPSSRGRRLDPLSMTRALRAQAERVRRALERAAGGRRVPWSFQVKRGRPIREALAAADGGRPVAHRGRDASRVAGARPR